MTLPVRATLVAITAIFLYSSACAMGPSKSQSDNCTVSGGEKLPVATGGSTALCAAIERAVSAHSPGIGFRADVKVLSSSRLTATVTANGRKLPEQHFASMDRPLTGASFERFAQALAAQLANMRQ